MSSKSQSPAALVLAVVAGVLFGVGLGISGMTQQEKVIGFLDLFGRWDPSLMFVMGGAVGVHFIAHRFVPRMRSPIFDTRFHLPTRRDVDKRLVLGAAIFGAGWALAGFCPGPALVSFAAGRTTAVVFVIAMTVGMVMEHVVSRALERPLAPTSGAAAGGGAAAGTEGAK